MSNDVINILGVPVHPLTVDELHEQIGAIIDRGERAQVLNVNVHCLNLAHEHPWLHETLNRAEIVFCDGAGVILGARILGHYIPERITYADWMWQLAQFADKRGDTLYFLGARPGVAHAAAERLQQQFPDLKIVGVQDGFFNKTPGHPENETVVRCINQARPNILVLGMGMPLQEQWLRDNWERLDVNIALTGGAAFDFVSGELKRAPDWMNNRGLEWLGRLMIEPKRLWRRYVVGNPLFLLRVLRERLKR